MANLWTALYVEEAGFVISAELVLVGTVCVLGLVTGLTCVRDAMVAELSDVSDAFRSVRQDFYYTGMHGCDCGPCGCPHSWTAGSCYFDDTQGAELGCTDEPCREDRGTEDRAPETHRGAGEHPSHEHRHSEPERKEGHDHNREKQGHGREDRHPDNRHRETTSQLEPTPADAERVGLLEANNAE